MLALDIRGRIKHFLHTWTALRTFVGNDYHITTHYLSTQDSITSGFLRVKHLGRTGELPDTFVHTSGLYHTTVLGNITLQYSQSTVLAISMLQIADTSIGTVGIQSLIISVLRTQLDVELVGRCTGIDTPCICINLFLIDVVFSNGFRQGHAIHTIHGCIQQTALRQFIQDIQNTTGTVHILNMIFLCIRCHLAQTRNPTGQHIDVVHREVHTRFMGNGQQVKHRIGRATHCNIQCHGIQEGFTGSNAFWQYAFIAFFIIFISILYNQCCCILKELGTVGMSSQNGSITWQGQTNGFIQAVHGIGRKHS